MNSNNVVNPNQGLFPSTNLLASKSGLAGTGRWLLTLVLFLISAAGFSQISGTKTVGNVGLGDDYTSLTDAFAAIQTNTLNGNIVLQLTTNYDAVNEAAFPINAPSSASIGTFNVNVYPTASGLSIGGTSASGIINLSGTKNITIDGRVNASGTTRDLVIFNSDITTGYTIRFINDAVANTLNYCSIRGGVTVATGTTTSGVILFSTAATTGNSNNTISNCDIRDAGSGFPQIAINSIGTAAFPNANNSLIDNNIANFWHATLASRGIDLGVGNTQWTITGNNFFQSTTRTSTATATQTQTVINSSSTAGSNYTITGNFIGGSNIGAGGTWTVAGSGLYRFFGMAIVAASTPASTIQDNLIRNFNIATNVNANPVFAGMVLQNGSFNVGTVTPNVIGQPNGNGSITITMGGSAAAVNTALQAFGIWMTGTVAASTYNVSNNQIGSFTLDAVNVTHALGFEGIIASAGSATAINITNNTVGSTATPNSINSPKLSVSGAQLLRGIDVQGTITGGNISVAVNNNIVANMNQNSTLYSVTTGATGANIRGIVVSPAAAHGIVTINNNQIYNISGAGATAPSFSSQGSEAGIVMFATGSNFVTISGNDIHDISCTNTNAVYAAVAGIVTSNAVSVHVTKNKICNLSNASTQSSTTQPPIVAGFWYGASGGPYYWSNNIVSLGNAQTTNTMFCGLISSGNSGGIVNMYFNTIKIAGTASSGSQPSWGVLRTASLATAFGAAASAGGTTFNLRNNLINNIRNGGTGKHYALGNISASGATGWSTTASNFNILNSTSPSAMGGWGVNPGTDYTLATWRTLTGGDASSLTGVSVTFVDPCDLHINMGVTGNQIESTGTPIANATVTSITPNVTLTFTGDIDNQVRPGPTGSVNGGGTVPDIGADEFDGVILDITAPTISYTLLNNTSLVGGETLTNFATVTDLGGVNVTVGNRPRLYFKRSTDANTFNNNTSGTAGWKYDEANGSVSPFAFAINYGLLSGGTGVSVGTIIQYFVVAEDLATPTPNVGINAGTFAAIPTSVNLSAPAFPIGGTLNSYNIVTAYAGVINVGTAETITSLTNANGLFDKLNNGALTASVTVNITSDLTAETGVFGLNQFAEDGGNTYTLTIQPTGAPRIISGIPSTPSLIKLNGADKVTINGSLNGAGTDRSLSIINYSQDYDLGNIPDNCVIHVSSPTSINGATNNTIKNCIVRGLSNLGTEYTIVQGGSDGGGDPGSGALSPNSNNTYLNNLIFAANYGILLNGSASNPDVNTVISGNVIGSPVNTLKTYFAGFWSQGQSGMQITDNNVLGVVGNQAGGAAWGIMVNSNVSNLILTGNNVSNIKNTSTTGGAAGIALRAFGVSTNMLIANNTISDVSAVGSGTVPTETNNGYGMTVVSGSGYRIYNNSVNLGTNQTGGVSAAFFVTTGVSAAGAIDLRNNAFATTQTNNTRYAIYVAAAGTVLGTINRNLYYNKTGANLGFLVSARSNLAAWQTATGQDANSISADPKYNTPIVLGPLAGSPMLAAGTPVAGVTKDQINITRSVTTPSIGAYELAGDYAAPVITYTPLPFTCNTGNVTLTANLTDFTGVSINPTFKARIYYKKNNGAFFSASGTQIGGSINDGTWTFTINTTTLGGVTVGDKIFYFVAAQDVSPNINLGTSPVGGFGGDVNAITAYPPSYDSFSVSTTLAPGTYTVGAGGNYTTLTAAINDYNTKCLSGPVVFTLLNTTYSTGTGETMPLQIEANAYASATNTLTIKPATGVTSTITGATGDVVVFNGADYVAFDGSNNGTNTRNLTVASTSGVSGSDIFFVVSLGAGEGATNNTIKNCTLQAASRGTGANAVTVNTFYGIYSGDENGGQGPDNDYLTIENNLFRLASIGVFATSNSTGLLNNWTIANNTFGEAVTGNSLSRTGVSVNFATNLTISGNTFLNINTTDLGSATGVVLGSDVSNAVISKNYFTDIQYSSTGSYGARAIDINTNLASSNIVIVNNAISNIRGAGSLNPGVEGVSGIRVLGTTDGVKIYYNSVNLAAGIYAGSATEVASAATYFAAGVTGIDMRNNILYSNRQNSNSASHRTYAVYSDAPSSAFTNINYNDYAVAGTQGVLGFIGSQRTTLAAVVTGFGGNANSVNVLPLFTSATDIHMTATGNCGIDNKGIFLAGYTTDIDGATRSGAPDMGADEFSSSDNQWKGTVSSLWDNAANWCTGLVPTASIDVTIPSGTPFSPVLNSASFTKNLTISTGATVGLSTFTLNVAGPLAGAGTFVGTTSSKLVLSGNGALGTLNTSGNIGNLTLSGTGSSLTLGTALNVYGELSVGGNVLTAGTNLLTIKSDINGTGSVGPISTGGAINSTSVTVERYINRNAFRAWRLLSVPVSGTQTFNQAWQEGAAPLADPNPGFGTLLTSISGGNGYDQATSGNSLLSFNNGNPGSFSPIPNTGNTMATNKGYFVYIRGNRSTGVAGGVFNPTATTLRTKGSLYQGSQSAITLPAGQNVLVGNVYASAIDFLALTKSPDVISFKLWDPKVAGTSNTGAYQTFSSTNGYDPVPGGGSYGNTPGYTRIESGQAFLTTSTGGGTIQLTETAKISGSRNVTRTSVTVQQLKANLYAVTNNGNELADGNSVVFDNNFSKGFDANDVIKASNFGENLGVTVSGKDLVIDARANANEEDEIQYSINNLKQLQYALEFVPKNLNADVEAYLKDNFEGTLTPVSFTANSVYKFKVTSNPASAAKDRFKLVFTTRASVPVSFIAVNAVPKAENVEVNWKMSAENGIKSYEVEHSADGVRFLNASSVAAKGIINSDASYIYLHAKAVEGTNYYRIKSIAKDGGVAYSKVVNTKLIKVRSIAVYPNPVSNGILNIQVNKLPEGSYSAVLSNKSGQIMHRFIFSNNNEGSGSRTTKLPSNLTAGVYELRVVCPDGTTVTNSVVISK